MLNTELYSRQQEVQGITIPETVSIVGCGGTGYWTALFLAMSGVENIILVDNDVIELSNLNRLPITKDSIGNLKITILKEHILKLRPTVRMERHSGKIMTETDCQILRGDIFCCTDNLKSQQLICAYAKKNNLKYQRIGYDGTILNVSKSFPLSFEEEAENAGGYSITPSWVIPAALAAALGVSSKLYKEICIMDDLEKIHITNSSQIPKGIKEKLETKYRSYGEEYVLDNIYDYIPDNYGCCDDCTVGDERYQEGYESGEESGYNRGHELGYELGYKEGIKVGEMNTEEQIEINKIDADESLAEERKQAFIEGYRQAKRDYINGELKQEI